MKTPFTIRKITDNPQTGKASWCKDLYVRGPALSDEALGILQRVLIGLENALLDQLFWVRSTLQALLEAVGPHVVFELSLLLLQGRRGVGRRQDVSLDEVFALRTGIETLPKVISCTLALELERSSLEGPKTWSAEVARYKGSCGNAGRKATYGAVVVSSRMCLFLRSWGSGRCCRCFSKLLRRSLLRTGEIGVASMGLASSEAMVCSGQ